MAQRAKVIFGVGWVLIALIRIPWRVRARAASVVVDRKTGTERSLLALVSAGMGALPLLHMFTRWLRFADRQLPSWAGWLGAASHFAGVWVLWRAHSGLGRYWSDSVQLRQGHALVTTGIYQHVRHPMYSAGWLLGIGQALLLQNRVAGPAGLLSFALLYLSRVPREEQMMLEQFGEHYRAYMERTGSVIPRRASRPALEGEAAGPSAVRQSSHPAGISHRDDGHRWADVDSAHTEPRQG